MRYSYEHSGKTINPCPGFIEELSLLVPVGAKRFLEWGAGCSTLLFQDLARERGGDVLTMEHDPNWLTSVAKRLNYGGSNIVLQDLDGPRQSQIDQGLHYASYPVDKGPFDFIMIDGRRRVECAVAALACSHKDTVIVLHDYRRARYQTLRYLYSFQDGPQFRRLIKGGK